MLLGGQAGAGPCGAGFSFIVIKGHWEGFEAGGGYDVIGV